MSLTERGGLVRRGVARDTAAVRHTTTFLVVTVATVLVTRGYLHVAGYPQIGGDGLHIAHVLWGGLAMAVAFVIQLSYVGPVLRPVTAVLGGIGFGLFVDEIGKFVTDDHDYFYGPTAALIYLTVVALVLLVEVLHGRRRHHPAEYLAVAADRVAAGLAGGFTPATRAEARDLLARAEAAGSGPEPGAAELRALVQAVPDDEVAAPDPVGAVVRRGERWLSAAADRPWAGWVTSLAVLAVAASSATQSVRALAGADAPVWVGAVALAGAAATAALVVVAVLRGLAGSRRSAAHWLRRAVLVSLLVTQPAVFLVVEWAAVAGLVVDLTVFALLGVALAAAGRDDQARRTA